MGNNYKMSANANMDMTLGSFVEIYFRDKAGELKERSVKNKRYMIKTHILPYFENKPMNSIQPADIIQWQNTIRAKGFAPTYLRMIQNQITALFTHASNIYNLANNPCKKVKKMGKSDADRIDFWTREEYDRFIETFEVGSRYYVLFEILFWTGCREGELLALTKSDFDFYNNKLHISKTYYRADCKDIITAPKTEQSVRTIDIPEFLKCEIKEYVDKLYELPDDERIFPIVAEAVQHALKRHAEKAGVKRIRVHSLRHSHVAYLINQGAQPLIIKERLGHRDISVFKAKQRKEVQELIAESERKIANMTESLEYIVRGYGYETVRDFMAEYNAARDENSDYEKELAEWKRKYGPKEELSGHDLIERMMEEWYRDNKQERNEDKYILRYKDRGAR